jgi:hypothetical protein
MFKFDTFLGGVAIAAVLVFAFFYAPGLFGGTTAHTPAPTTTTQQH